ncbi:50S ribosomal protein L29 [candidate division WWE3 bacterium CG08_land_8_20_14_0_20_40_13]|uniref:Large ribosomal subunit protein uL29 n=1 Tax=candidate division WWE3 bacterium CG08_land_8_20_14_0_20_40_13 TaxID=1975084 RepID=A0A2H0XEJ3_UNCKA|nr:MAG: 50S ribosomal protein L29 [candidate division WWE3 bacterium CG08_land_8_20_14_0_20_40_13]
MATIREYREKNDDILTGDFKALAKKLQDAKFSLNMGKLKDLSQLSKIKKEMAQIQTIISERRILKG